MRPETLGLLFPQFDDVVDSGSSHPPILPPSCSSEVEQLGTPSCLSGVHTAGGPTGAPNPQFSGCLLLPAPHRPSRPYEGKAVYFFFPQLPRMRRV